MSFSYITNQDYYQILELPRSCTQEQIAESYRKLSLKYHPKRATKEQTALYEYIFQKIAEAYEVLGDPQKKQIFDIYGKAGLINGVIDIKGNMVEPYNFQGNGHEIFEKFMGTSNPFTLLRDEHSKNDLVLKAFNAYHNKEQLEKMQKLLEEDNLPPIDLNLECTLEELYNGCWKTVYYRKKTLNADMLSTVEEDKQCTVEIIPGHGKTNVIEFKNKGHESPGLNTSSLFVHIVEKEHPCFKRVNKNDLIYCHTLTLSQALNSVPVKFTTLDGRILSISMDEIISQNTVKKVEGEGMPILSECSSINNINKRKGDLYIKFNIIFPEHIDPEKKQEITELLEAQSVADLEEEKKKEWKRNQVFRDMEELERKRKKKELEILKEMEELEIAERLKFKRKRAIG